MLMYCKPNAASVRSNMVASTMQNNSGEGE